MAVSRRASPSGSAVAGLDLPYRLSVEGCLSASIATSGLTPAKLELWLRRLEPHLARLRTQAEDGTLPLLRLGRETADIDAAEAAYKRLVRGAETVVFLGTGGSSLGGQTLAQLAGWNIPGDAGPERRKGPRTRFYDNLDARTLERSLASLDLAATRFVVISKSGGTPETLVQLVAAFRLLLPDVGLVLSTRESANLRDGLFPLGITLASAGSHTEPGGYTGAGREHIHRTERGRIVELAAGASEWAAVSGHSTNATGQFEIADERSPEEIAALIRRLGYEPVWKDWDAALSA